MYIIPIQKQASRLQGMRAAAKLAEVALVHSLHAHLDAERGTALALAERLGVSPAYLSDVRHGKRGVGDEFLRKLCEVG